MLIRFSTYFKRIYLKRCYKRKQSIGLNLIVGKREQIIHEFLRHTNSFDCIHYFSTVVMLITYSTYFKMVFFKLLSQEKNPLHRVRLLIVSELQVIFFLNAPRKNNINPDKFQYSCWFSKAKKNCPKGL